MTPSGCIEKKSKFTCPQANDIFTIAYFHDTIYFLTRDQGLFYTTGDQPGSCVFVSPFEPATSMVAAPDGTLYAANGGNIIFFDPHTKQRIDNNLVPFNATGDLIFHNNKLYMAADPDVIVEINLAAPELSKEIMSLSLTWNIGLASSPGPCGNDLVYAISVGKDPAEILGVDIDNAKEIGQVCLLKAQYQDAASAYEQPAIGIDSINIIPVCGSNTFSSALHITAHGASGSTLTYDLGNGDENTTGIFPGLEPGNYTLRVSSSSTCFADTTVNIYKSICNKTLIVPNAFTPNQDGRNDILRPLGAMPASGVIFSIYNRYGQKIFETKDFFHGWDGTFSGVKQPSGTYVWVLRYVNDSGTIVTGKGTTVLVR